MGKIRTYSELMTFETFGERLEYLKLWDERYLSPRSLDYDFYHSPAWSACRKDMISRDQGWDLGVVNVGINGIITVHHINPLTPEDLENWNIDKLFNPENLITVSDSTHKTIHYKPKEDDFIERAPNDIKLW